LNGSAAAGLRIFSHNVKISSDVNRKYFLSALKNAIVDALSPVHTAYGEVRRRTYVDVRQRSRC